MKVLISDVYESCDILLSCSYWKRDTPWHYDILLNLKEKMLKIYTPISVTGPGWTKMSLTKMSKKLYTDATEYTEIGSSDYEVIKGVYTSLNSSKKENRSRIIENYGKEHKSYIKLERLQRFWGFMQKLFCADKD